MDVKAFRIFSIFLLVLGLLLLFFSQPYITGATVGGLSGSEQVTGTIFGFSLLCLFVFLLLIGGKGEVETEIEEAEKEVETAEEVTNKLFVKREQGVLFVDYQFKIGENLGHPITTNDAEQVLEELKELAKDKELKQILIDSFKEGKYIQAAYAQRDTCRNIEPGSVGFYADEFLRLFDADYKKFEPPKSPLLVFEEDSGLELVEHKGVYDTREILPMMERNIPGLKIVDKTIGNHDVNVEYHGAKFQVFAGSIKDYEVPRKNILRMLSRIAREDVKRKAISKSDQDKRMQILRKYTFK